MKEKTKFRLKGALCILAAIVTVKTLGVVLELGVLTNIAMVACSFCLGLMFGNEEARRF